MSNVSLEDFTGRVAKTGTMVLQDVERLHRDILVDGLTCRAQAEALFDLDGRLETADPAWLDSLAALVVDFVVWGERPTGYVDQAQAAWLASALPRARSRTAAFLLAEIGAEAQDVAPLVSEIAASLRNSRKSAGASRRDASLAA